MTITKTRTTPGHPTTETFLDQHACTYEYHPGLPIDTIDLDASRRNQSRDIPLERATVDRYAAAITEGAEFPPIITRRVHYRRNGDTLIILGGNHRTHGHLDAGRTTIDAYIVDCDDRTALEIAYADNALHGLPPTEAERLAHALQLISLDRTAADAARIVGIDPQRIYRAQNEDAVVARARSLGVARQLDLVPRTVRPRLAAIEDARVFTELVKAIVLHDIPTTDANRLIGDLNAQPTVKAKLDLLEVHIKHHSATRPARRQAGRPSADPYLMARAALGTIRALNASDIVEGCPPSERNELQRLLKDGARHLMAIDQLAEIR